MDELDKLRQELETLRKENIELRRIVETIADRQYIEESRRVVAVNRLMNAVTGNIPLNPSIQQKISDQLNKERTAMQTKIDNNIKGSLQGGFEENDLMEQFICQNVPDGLEIQRFVGNEDGDTLYIPKKIHGRKVKGIGKNAFCNSDFTAVYLPDGIKYLAERAFYGCRKLEAINFPDTIVKIGKECFSGSGLTSIVVPDSLKVLETRCFSYCRQLKSVLLNECLEHIQPAVFEWTDISRIVFPQSILEIEQGVFKGLTGVEMIFLNAEIKMNLREYSFMPLTVYCLSGSKIRKEAREIGITVKPLNEFRNV